MIACIFVILSFFFLFYSFVVLFIGNNLIKLNYLNIFYSYMLHFYKGLLIILILFWFIDFTVVLFEDQDIITEIYYICISDKAKWEKTHYIRLGLRYFNFEHFIHGCGTALKHFFSHLKDKPVPIFRNGRYSFLSPWIKQYVNLGEKQFSILLRCHMVFWPPWHIDPGVNVHPWYIEPPYWKSNPMVFWSPNF